MFHYLCPLFLLLSKPNQFCPMQNRACTLDQPRKGMQISHMLKANQGRGRVGHVFPPRSSPRAAGSIVGGLSRCFACPSLWFCWSPSSQIPFSFSSYLTLLLEKVMAPHSSTLAWKIPWTEDPVRLQSMGSRRVGHDWATSLSLFTFMHWRRKWQPTPVFLPGESQGRGSLMGCRLWGRTESDTTEAT